MERRRLPEPSRGSIIAAIRPPLGKGWRPGAAVSRARSLRPWHSKARSGNPDGVLGHRGAGGGGEEGTGIDRHALR